MAELVTASNCRWFSSAIRPWFGYLFLLQQNRKCEILILAYRPAPDRGVRTNGKLATYPETLWTIFTLQFTLRSHWFSCIVVYVLRTYFLHVSPVRRTLTIEQSSGATICVLVNSSPLARSGNSPSDLYRRKSLYVVTLFLKTLIKTGATGK